MNKTLVQNIKSLFNQTTQAGNLSKSAFQFSQGNNNANSDIDALDTRIDNVIDKLNLHIGKYQAHQTAGFIYDGFDYPCVIARTGIFVTSSTITILPTLEYREKYNRTGVFVSSIDKTLVSTATTPEIVILTATDTIIRSGIFATSIVRT